MIAKVNCQSCSKHARNRLRTSLSSQRFDNVKRIRFLSCWSFFFLCCNQFFSYRTKRRTNPPLRIKKSLYFQGPKNLVFILLKCGGRESSRRLQVYERVGILLVEVYWREEKSVIWVCERAQMANRWILWLYKVENTFYFCDWILFKRPCIYSSKKGCKVLNKVCEKSNSYQ